MLVADLEQNKAINNLALEIVEESEVFEGDNWQIKNCQGMDNNGDTIKLPCWNLMIPLIKKDDKVFIKSGYCKLEKRDENPELIVTMGFFGEFSVERNGTKKFYKFRRDKIEELPLPEEKKE